jgi:prepilin-type N-terminal cleavage/methylation domain-containing protein
MFKLMRKNRKGFTLIELIVVIAILAILAAIAIPTFSGITASADEKVELANARSIATAYNAYNALHPDAQLGAVADSQQALTDAGLWPSGITAADLAGSLAMITVTNGVAVAAVPAAAAQ